jgi:hypothetical protein
MTTFYFRDQLMRNVEDMSRTYFEPAICFHFAARSILIIQFAMQSYLSFEADAISC